MTLGRSFLDWVSYGKKIACPIAKDANFMNLFRVNLQRILSWMNYIAATLGEAQHKNCVGLYVGKQKLNGRLRIPDAALTLFAKTDTHTNTYTLMPHCLLRLATSHRVDQKNIRRRDRLDAWTWTWSREEEKRRPTTYQTSGNKNLQSFGDLQVPPHVHC